MQISWFCHIIGSLFVLATPVNSWQTFLYGLRAVLFLLIREENPFRSQHWLTEKPFHFSHLHSNADLSPNLRSSWLKFRQWSGDLHVIWVPEFRTSAARKMTYVTVKLWRGVGVEGGGRYGENTAPRSLWPPTEEPRVRVRVDTGVFSGEEVRLHFHFFMATGFLPFGFRKVHVSPSAWINYNPWPTNYCVSSNSWLSSLTSMVPLKPFSSLTKQRSWSALNFNLLFLSCSL